jgi:hypothetical protein
MASATDFLSVFKDALNASYKPGAVAKDVFKNPAPSFKGIDFTTGKTVDLGKYSGGFAIGTEPPFAEKSEPKTGEFKSDPTSPTRGFWDEILDPRGKEFRQETSRLRREENLYDALLAQQMFQSYIPAMERLAKSTRLTDYQLGLMADIQSPTRQQERAASAQQQMATATGSEAAMLNAVNQAAYNNAMANIAGLRSGMRRG